MTNGFKVLDAQGRIKTANDPSGMVIGTTVEAWDADLDALAAQTGSGVMCKTAAATYAQRVLTAGVGVAITDGGGITGNPTIAVNAESSMVMTGPINLTAAQIRGLSSTPVEILPQPAAGKALIVHRLIVQTTIVAVFSTAPTYSTRYSGVATDLTTAAGFTNTTGAWITATDAVANFNITGVNVLALPVVIRSSADITSGVGNTAKVWVAYSTIDTN